MVSSNYESKHYLLHKLLEWIYEQREFHLPNSRLLLDEERQQLAGYFDQSILDSTRVAIVARIPNPEFYNELTKLNISIPLDFAQVIGLTLIDCVLIRKELYSSPSSWITTLFHEIVHVVQFDILSPMRGIELLTDYLLQGKCQYLDFPIEQQAYTLTERFARGEPPFSVREIVEPELRQMI